MMLDVFSVRHCSLDPNCQLDLENVDLLNQVIVYGMAGMVGVLAITMFAIYAILAVRKVVAKVQQLLGTV